MLLSLRTHTRDHRVFGNTGPNSDSALLATVPPWHTTLQRKVVALLGCVRKPLWLWCPVDGCQKLKAGKHARAQAQCSKQK